MKDYCVSCLEKIYQTYERYVDVGNYCADCIRKANEAIEKKRVDKVLLDEYL